MRATQYTALARGTNLCKSESIRRCNSSILPPGFDDEDEAIEIVAGKLRLVDRTNNAIDFTFEMEA